MAQTPNPFWAEVKAQALAGVMVAGAIAICGGLGYLIHRVPRQLDQVLENQKTFQGRLDTVERQADELTGRVIRLEATR